MLLRRFARYLPFPIRQQIRMAKYRLQLATGRFRSDEPEFRQLPELVRAGDWVLDIGANVGQYTLRLSELVGDQGRVIAFEPIAETAEILAAMACRARYRNITLMNVAVSERAGLLRFRVPPGQAGLPNYFQARASDDGDRTVLSLALDQLPWPHRVALVKIDVEQHEVAVLHGMRNLLDRDRPVLIVEAHEGVYPDLLAAFGYRLHPQFPGSSNLVLTHPRSCPVPRNS